MVFQLPVVVGKEKKGAEPAVINHEVSTISAHSPSNEAEKSPAIALEVSKNYLKN